MILYLCIIATLAGAGVILSQIVVDPSNAKPVAFLVAGFLIVIWVIGYLGGLD